MAWCVRACVCVVSGLPNYCPLGTNATIPIEPGYYGSNAVAGNGSGTFTTHTICPAGSYCAGLSTGVALCPAGTYVLTPTPATPLPRGVPPLPATVACPNVLLFAWPVSAVCASPLRWSARCGAMRRWPNGACFCVESPPCRYGNKTGLSDSACSGQCPPGYYCPAGTTNATANPCGNVTVFCGGGVGAPSLVDSTKYSTPLWVAENVRFNQTPCDAGYSCNG